MMRYCPEGLPLYVVWEEGAFSHCFIDTLTAVLLTFIMTVCGGAELRMYAKYGTALDRALLGPPPVLYVAQLVLSLFVAALNPLRLLLRALSAGQLFGYALVKDGVGAVVWSASAALVFIERNYDLPTNPSRGHSIHLNIFWGIALAVDSLYIINMRGNDWFFQLERTHDVAFLALFVIEWLCELVLFVLGISAPGIVSNRQRNQYIYRQMEETPAKVQYGSLSGESSSNDVSVLEASTASTLNSSVQLLLQGLRSAELLDQYSRLWRQSQVSTIAVAQRRENMLKNRYLNVLPYDHCRVVLRTTQQSSDYINASWIVMQPAETGLTGRYVATQGPKPESVADFWRMVWQQRSALIVMLTELVESGVRKCEAYWPALGESMQLDGLVVSCSHVEPSARRTRPWTVREFFLVELGGRDELTVAQMQLHGWPDHGAPKDSARLVDFWRAVRTRLPERRQGAADTPPVVVHCSAGVGRSGAFILLETLILCIEADVPLRPVELVQSMRQQRMAMVQTEEQFVFACRAALAYYEWKCKQKR